MFIWTDIETTGLDPDNDLILSLGLIVTDDNFKEVGRFESDIFAPASVKNTCTEFVQDMHTKNGLWVRCLTAQLKPDVEEQACHFLDSVLGPPAPSIKDRPCMAGNSVHFDRSFLVHDMSGLMNRFNYRMLDVSTLKVLAYATVPGAKEWDLKRDPANHTPLKDLEGSIAELAHWRQVLWGVP